MVHLAFIVDPIHDEKKMYDVNVNGTLNVLGWKPRYTSRETLRIMLETHDYNPL
jgi:nucleoside-diphosphate-sugar epimerase